MAEYQKKLSFSLKELVPFRADQLVREIKSASLEPNVICHEHGQYVILRGKLVFCGEYYPRNYEVQEDFFAEHNVADVYRNNENGCCTFNYAFPVDITIPQDRVISTDEISIGINNFDCSVQESGFVNVSADLFVDGVYDREYVEHVRYQNQAGVSQVNEIPSFNVTDGFNESVELKNNFETSQEFMHNQEFTAENSGKQYADFRSTQSDDWDNQQHINSNINQNEHNETAQNNKESYDEQIKYHTTYDYDPWNQNFNNNNTYSKADYYRNPYEATYQGGAGTQYYNQPHEKLDSNDTNSEDSEADFINQYVKFNPKHKPEFEEVENSNHDIKFIPEDNTDIHSEDVQISFERPLYNEADYKPFETVHKNHQEVTSGSNFTENNEEAHHESLGAINSHKVELDIENPTKKRSDGYDKVVFPFEDDDNAFEHTDDYEFCAEPHVQPKKDIVQENSKSASQEIGKSRVISDIFNVRGKEDRSACLKIYIVQHGDSLEQLAEKYSTNVSKIANFNQLQLNDKILEGQVIYIPE